MDIPDDALSYAEYICQESRDLNTESLIKLGSIVFDYNEDKIKEGTDGSRILLDDIPKNILKQMAIFIQNQLNIIST